MPASKTPGKPGKHGTLYRYEITYQDENPDPGDPTFTWRTWAYDVAHAMDRFYDGPDEGWVAVSARRV